MLGRDFCQGGRGCNHESQSDERSGVEIEDGAHVRVRLPKLVCKIMRVGIFRELGYCTGEDEHMAEYRIVRWHRLPEGSGFLPPKKRAPMHSQNLASSI